MNWEYLLKSLTVVTPEHYFEADLRICKGRIIEIGLGLKPNGKEIVLECLGQAIYPGLINSHDHLAFNFFPRLGEPPYNNAYEWGKDLHKKYKTIIESIQRIPYRHRLLWGGWKNLFSGVTSVVHHDAYSRYFRLDFPVDVLRRYTFAHSLQFDPKLQRALYRRKWGVPFLIHLAEGKDEISASEVTSLKDLGGLDNRTVAVHAVGITDNDVHLLTEARTSVVWCPSSNLFLFGKTAPVRSLLGKIQFALGTDSTLTGNVSLFDELRTARKKSSLSAKELFALVTIHPRTIFGLPTDVGELRQDGRANLFLLPLDREDPYEMLLGANPGNIGLLMKGGRIIFYDPSLFTNLVKSDLGARVYLNGKIKLILDQRFSRLYARLKPFVHHYAYLNSD